MTLRHVYDHFVKTLAAIYEKQEAENITLWIFEEKLGITKAGLVIRENETLSEVKANDLAYKLVRLLKGEPVQYVLGGTEFYRLKLKVNKNVLIPRPETEELVELIINEQTLTTPYNILDIGTGSGCIAIALKKNLPHATVFGVDISKEALEVAGENARLNNADILFVQSDILNTSMHDELPQDPFAGKDFMVIASNPPYIPESERAGMHTNVVGFEPNLALFVPDKDPLVFYKTIAVYAKKRLSPSGHIYVEVHENKADAVAALFKTYGYQRVSIHKDLNGKERVVKAGW